MCKKNDTFYQSISWQQVITSIHQRLWLLKCAWRNHSNFWPVDQVSIWCTISKFWRISMSVLKEIKGKFEKSVFNESIEPVFNDHSIYFDSRFTLTQEFHYFKKDIKSIKLFLAFSKNSNYMTSSNLLS